MDGLPKILPLLDLLCPILLIPGIGLGDFGGGRLIEKVATVVAMDLVDNPVDVTSWARVSHSEKLSSSQFSSILASYWRFKANMSEKNPVARFCFALFEALLRNR